MDEIFRNDIYDTISSFIEAMLGVAVAREDDDFVAAVLQPYSGIDNQPFSSSNPQVGVEERDCFLIS